MQKDLELENATHTIYQEKEHVYQIKFQDAYLKNKIMRAKFTTTNPKNIQ